MTETPTNGEIAVLVTVANAVEIFSPLLSTCCSSCSVCTTDMDVNISNPTRISDRGITYLPVTQTASCELSSSMNLRGMSLASESSIQRKGLSFVQRQGPVGLKQHKHVPIV